MNKIKIVTDSCCSLTKAELDILGVDCAETSVMIDDELFYAFDPKISDPEKYYETIKDAKKISTGCVNVQSFTDIFEKYAHLGYDVVYVGLSSGLSSTYDNAVHAAENVNKTCGKHIWVADSLTGSFSIAYMIEEALKMVAQNKTAEEICAALDKNGLRTQCYFMPSDLNFLSRCGRLNKVVATVGTLLKIAPTLMNSDGKLKMMSKTLGRKKAFKALEALLLEKMDTQRPEKIFIGHTGQLAEAEELKAFLEQNTKNKTFSIGYIDYTMGASCGPQTLAVFITLK